MGGREVPGTWSEALEILRNNYANSLVIQALADALHYKLVIITVHGDENFVKTIEPKEGTAGNTLFFGHTGNHYIALRPKEKVISPSHEASQKEPVKSKSSYPLQHTKTNVKTRYHIILTCQLTYAPSRKKIMATILHTPKSLDLHDALFLGRMMAAPVKRKILQLAYMETLFADNIIVFLFNFSEGKVKADIDSDSDELLSKSVFSLTEKRLKLDPSLWFGVDVEVVNELPYDIDGSKVFQVRFHKDGRNIHDGRPWKPWVTSSRKGFRGKRNVQSCRGSYLCTNKNCPYKNNLEEQTVSSSLDLEETNFADLATSKVNTFLAQLGRSVNIQKVLTLQPFTILGITLAQLFLSPSYTQTVTLNSFSKHIQWLSPLQFQLPS
ncbi:unnamed protein product [Porites lobata]|uniref:OTU domain-containing protein n=1 Tax=Porites lobata TaxID=104759 RepID=A0ABN8N2E7_9CNID|nr:unnamed protein product [Porites lobata]